MDSEQKPHCQGVFSIFLVDLPRVFFSRQVCFLNWPRLFDFASLSQTLLSALQWVVDASLDDLSLSSRWASMFELWILVVLTLLSRIECLNNYFKFWFHRYRGDNNLIKQADRPGRVLKILLASLYWWWDQLGLWSCCLQWPSQTCWPALLWGSISW